MVANNKLAAEELIRVHKTVPFEDVLDTALGVLLMWQLAPRYFEDDESLRFQLVRRVLRLSSANIDTYEKGGKAYRDVAPRTTRIVAEGLLEVFGATGLKLAQLEQADQDKLEEERRVLDEAFRKLE
jgi:hypothetical protein